MCTVQNLCPTNYVRFADFLPHFLLVHSIKPRNSLKRMKKKIGNSLFLWQIFRIPFNASQHIHFAHIFIRGETEREIYTTCEYTTDMPSVLAAHRNCACVLKRNRDTQPHIRIEFVTDRTHSHAHYHKLWNLQTHTRIGNLIELN